MSRVGFVEHKGKTLVEVNLSNCNPDEAIATIKEAMALIKTQDRNSVLLMTDVTGAVQNKDSVAAVKDFCVSNVPYVRASAVVGVDESKQPILAMVRFLTLHEIKHVETLAEGRDYLVTK